MGCPVGYLPSFLPSPDSLHTLLDDGAIVETYAFSLGSSCVLMYCGMSLKGSARHSRPTAESSVRKPVVERLSAHIDSVCTVRRND